MRKLQLTIINKRTKESTHLFSESVILDLNLQEIRKQAMKEIQSDENLKTAESKEKLLKAT